MNKEAKVVGVLVDEDADDCATDDDALGELSVASAVDVVVGDEGTFGETDVSAAVELGVGGLNDVEPGAGAVDVEGAALLLPPPVSAEHAVVRSSSSPKSTLTLHATDNRIDRTGPPKVSSEDVSYLLVSVQARQIAPPCWHVDVAAAPRRCGCRSGCPTGHYDEPL